jgi:hypothetical protein
MCDCVDRICTWQIGPAKSIIWLCRVLIVYTKPSHFVSDMGDYMCFSTIFEVTAVWWAVPEVQWPVEQVPDMRLCPGSFLL